MRSPRGWRQTLPANGGGYTITGVNGQGFVAKFGMRQLPGSISAESTATSTATAWRIRAKLVSGNQPSLSTTTTTVAVGANEPYTTTAADGTYSIPNLNPGTFVVREVGQPAIKRTGLDPVAVRRA